MHSTDHHAATRRSHRHTAAGCKLTDAHLFPFPSRTSPNGHEGPKANRGPHASRIPHEHVDPVSQVRPPRGNRATERPSRVNEPQVGHHRGSQAPSAVGQGKQDEPKRRRAARATWKRSPCRARSPRALKSGVPAAPGRMLASRQARRYGRIALGGMWCRFWDGASSSHKHGFSGAVSGSGGFDPVPNPEGVDADACMIHCWQVRRHGTCRVSEALGLTDIDCLDYVHRVSHLQQATWIGFYEYIHVKVRTWVHATKEDISVVDKVTRSCPSPCSLLFSVETLAKVSTIAKGRLILTTRGCPPAISGERTTGTASQEACPFQLAALKQTPPK
ncbi:hypothetical protein B0T18DRAFT_214470 [Schizothecium vesticola]|uniref:Uncharacterized protein n=1 Tax=Schizothecium vesticola TaxID=314040 RepID=A0AA40EJU2_9PEZI|nr:hypothetical protein B0T18DRAFT_214470 [Schizothecium vesticola]